MASVTEPFAGSDAEKSVTLLRATPGQQRVGLGLLLVGKPRGDDPAIDHFLAFTQQQKMSLGELWLAFRGPTPVASVLLIPSPGRTAVIFVSPTISSYHDSVESRLIRHACAAQDRSRVALVQAILDPGQEFENLALTQAGLKYLAQLIYMQRTTAGGDRALPLDTGVTASRWNAANRPLFAAAIQRSYEQTLDCPGLLGLRTIDDIISGHMSSGKFLPELWLALHHGDEPVGVMLVNLVPQRRAAELVYLGLSPAWRGRGIARKLLRHAIALASEHDAATLSLAVDDHNAPAMRLYEAMGFRATARKVAMIQALA